MENWSHRQILKKRLTAILHTSTRALSSRSLSVIFIPWSPSMPMVALDSEFYRRSCPRGIFYGSDLNFVQTLKKIKSITATMLEELFWEISIFDQNPPQIKTSFLPFSRKLQLQVSYACLKHGTLVKFWDLDSFSKTFFLEILFSPTFVVVFSFVARFDNKSF